MNHKHKLNKITRSIISSSFWCSAERESDLLLDLKPFFFLAVHSMQAEAYYWITGYHHFPKHCPMNHLGRPLVLQCSSDFHYNCEVQDVDIHWGLVDEPSSALF